MRSGQILQLLHVHDRDGLFLVASGEVMTLDGDSMSLAPELLRLANLGAALEQVRTRHPDHAPLSLAVELARATWPRPTP